MSDQGGRGQSSPLGATFRDGGVNFSVFSKSATGLELLLFERADDPAPASTITLDPLTNRSGHYWHVFIPGLKAGQLYAYRARGPFDPEKGLRYDPAKVLLDPYGLAVAVPKGCSREAASRPGDNAATAFKSVTVDPGRYDWEGDMPIKRPFRETVIYEMHVRGFTRDASSGVARGKRGTYAGVIGKIPYLKDLGVTAVELLPVFQYDSQDAPPGLVNYWGYSPVSFFAPHVAYSSRRSPLGVLDEFRDMVKALHRAGIEVILDVVYNHTAEGNEHGPTICFRGLENSAYYILESDRSAYADYTGTGNTLNANHPVVRRMIVDSLRYWVQHMHVDGFRFDLASILSRDESGHPLDNPPVILNIDTEPALANVKLIAEAWDAGGLYQVGNFSGDFWKEWNGRFRDDVRRFVKGDRGTVSSLACRFLGSPDIYVNGEREAERSINFITCHDGFTLNDLVSYNVKHNEANGERNRDGSDDNLSWNCGIEGPTADPAVEQLRNRQVKNFLAITLMAIGTPMLAMGDEVRRTQGGNNNAYCQDNSVSWFDWTLLEKHRDVYRFVRQLISHRLRLDIAKKRFSMTLDQLLRRAKIHWDGVRLDQPDWSYNSHSLALTAPSLSGDRLFHCMLNAYWEALVFQIPRLDRPGGERWHRVLDTALESPEDICEPGAAPVIDGATYNVQPRSVVVLVAAVGPGGGEGKDGHGR